MYGDHVIVIFIDDAQLAQTKHWLIQGDDTIILFPLAVLWNDLDENIKEFSLSAFKNKLKQSFLESY